MRRHGDELLAQPRGLLQALVGFGQLVDLLAQVAGGPVDPRLQLVGQGTQPAVGLVELGDTLAERAGKLAALDAARHRSFQLFDVAGLDEIVVGALAECVDGRLERGVTGQHDRRRVGRVLAHLGEERETGAGIEAQVSEQQIERRRTQVAECLLDGGRLYDLAALLLEDSGHRLLHARLIVHQEDARR